MNMNRKQRLLIKIFAIAVIAAMVLTAVLYAINLSV